MKMEINNQKLYFTEIAEKCILQILNRHIQLNERLIFRFSKSFVSRLD